jgi:F-type H+-transporting ATPase subunit a
VDSEELNVSLKPEQIHIFGFGINNSLLTMIIVMILLAILMISALGRPKLVPGRWQAFWEFAVESVLNQVENNLGRNKTSRRIFPLIATFFIFILFANWFSLLPGVGSIGFYEREIAAPSGSETVALTANPPENYALINANTAVAGANKEIEAGEAVQVQSIQGNTATIVAVQEKTGEGKQFVPLTGDHAITGQIPTSALTPAHTIKKLIPILRAPNADLNMTLAMALIAVITANVVAIMAHGVGGWLKEFFPKPYVMTPLLTPIEIVGQFSRIISLTFRLFGNIFAGEVLLAIILKLAAPVLVIFIGLELFFGFIQALVFMSLSLAYIALGLGSEGAEHGHEADLDELTHTGELELEAAPTRH